MQSFYVLECFSHIRCYDRYYLINLLTQDGRTPYPYCHKCVSTAIQIKYGGKVSLIDNSIGNQLVTPPSCCHKHYARR